MSARERTNQSDVARTQPRKLLGLGFSFGRVAASHLPGSARLACWSRRLAETNFSIGLPYRHSRPNILFRLMTDEEAIATVHAELSRRFISGHGLDHGGIDLLVVPTCGEHSIATDRKLALRMCSPILAMAASEPAETATRSICGMCIRFLPASVTRKRKFNARHRSGQALAKVRRSFPRLDSSEIRGAVACRV